MSRSNGDSHHAKTSADLSGQSHFLDCIVTGDESWVFHYDPEMKRQSLHWTSKLSPRPKNFGLQKSKIETMLFTFFDKQDVIHKEFLCPKGRQLIVLSM
jgi:hypothetical protein